MKKVSLIISAVVIASMMLSSCGGDSSKKEGASNKKTSNELKENSSDGEVINDDNLKNEDVSNRYSESETTGGKFGQPLLLKSNNKTVNGIVFYTNAIGYYYEDNYKNGVLHGLCQVWDEKDGRLLESNNFKEGKNHGICIQYWNFDIDFQKKSVKTYNEGKLVESECYDTNGNRENCKELQVYGL